MFGSFSKLVKIATESANQSVLAMRHGAVLFNHSGRQVININCNSHGSKICGYDVPSIHAEANCLKSVYNLAGRLGCREQPKGPPPSQYYGC